MCHLRASERLDTGTGSSREGKPTSEHKLWTVQRIIPYLIILLYADLLYFNIGKILLLGACLILASPFFHDGFYYWGRHRLDNSIYKKGFWDQSTTSTALLTKFCTPTLRTIYFLTSLIIFIIFVIEIQRIFIYLPFIYIRY